MNATIQECSRVQSRFLDLPPEIRLKIYRLLHVHSRTIGDCRDCRNSLRQCWDWEQFSLDWFGPGSSRRDRYNSQKPSCEYSSDPGSSTCSLSGQLLATCRLVHDESSNILYGENFFGLYIYIREGWNYGGNPNIKIETSFFEGFEINDLDLPWPTPKRYPRGTETDDPSKRLHYQFAINRIRRLRLVLDLDSESSPASYIEYNLLKHVLHFVCQRVKDLPLQYLNIDLHSRYPMTRFCVLDPLRILRGISKVTFEPEPQNPRVMRLGGSFHLKSNVSFLRRRPKRDRSLATLPSQVANYLKQLLESSTPVDNSLLRSLSFQFVATYLRLNEAPSPVENHLRLLYGDHLHYDCFEGPYKACKHPPDHDLYNYEKQVVSDNESDDLESESEWESRSNGDELEKEKDEIEEDELEGDGLEGDGLEERRNSLPFD